MTKRIRPNRNNYPCKTRNACVKYIRNLLLRFSNPWYVCSVDGCKEQWDAAPHMFDNGVCVFCGKTDARHVHQWSQAWEKNEYFHWHPCTADGCEIIEDSQKDGFAPHDYTNGGCVCGQGWLNFRLNPDNESCTVYGINARGSYYQEITVPEITIPSTFDGKPVTITSGDEIPDNAFENRANLRIVEIASTVKRIGKYAFADCGQLGMYLEGHPGRRITIPEGVTYIGDHAFSGCTSLESITLPDSLTHIGDNVFDGCAHLEKITFQGTVAEWRAVEKGTDWNRQTGDYVIWCSDGKIGKND